MPSEAPPQATSPGPAGGNGTGHRSDWAADAATRIEALVSTVRANTVDRLAAVVRGLVVGIVGVVLVLMTAVLLTVAAVRGLDVALPRGVWLPDVVLGAIFSVLGLFLWSKRTAR
ncbi:MAG: hypothetical protein ACRD0Q_12300 [Acidimicrobiales bacterium]